MHYKDLIGSSEYEECHEGDEGAFWVDLPPMLQEEYPSGGLYVRHVREPALPPKKLHATSAEQQTWMAEMRNPLMGAICGDIAGLPYEFRGTRTKDYHFEMKLTDFSDDTILTIAVADWIANGKRTAERLKKLLLKYAKRFIDKDVWGRGFMEWVKSDGTIDRTGVRSNGAAMRVTAIGYASDNLEEVRRLADISARVTHDSDEASRGAQAVASAIFLMRHRGTSFRFSDHTTCHLTDRDIRHYLTREFGYQFTRSIEEIRKDYQFEIFCDKCVPEALSCALEDARWGYEQTIRHAVSLGGDADTMAAIAGGVSVAAGNDIPREIFWPCYDLLPVDFEDIIRQFNGRQTVYEKRR